MKNMVTAIACILLLMAFLAQFVQNQVLFQKLALVQGVVAQEDAGPEDLRREISSLMGCAQEDVVVLEEEKETMVQFPVSPVLVSPAFWGIADDENVVHYVIRQKKHAETGGE